ncbi:MAG TPA: hypothetical protein VEH51_09735 [Burkholderiales bacterium]|nr:hypothetical protein [Burkholderiales bacterium]
MKKKAKEAHTDVNLALFGKRLLFQHRSWFARIIDVIAAATDWRVNRDTRQLLCKINCFACGDRVYKNGAPSIQKYCAGKVASGASFVALQGVTFSIIEEPAVSGVIRCAEPLEVRLTAARISRIRHNIDWATPYEFNLRALKVGVNRARLGLRLKGLAPLVLRRVPLRME